MKLLVCFLAIVGIVVLAADSHEECQPQFDDELIWEYNVRRSYRLGAYQEVEPGYGPTRAIITCIKINSLSDADNGGAWITSGGIGYNFVRLKLRSKYSTGLRYKVFVYGKTTNRAK